VTTRAIRNRCIVSQSVASQLKATQLLRKKVICHFRGRMGEREREREGEGKRERWGVGGRREESSVWQTNSLILVTLYGLLPVNIIKRKVPFVQTRRHVFICAMTLSYVL